MPKLHFVKKARKDNPVVKKGESYYWWQFAYCSKSYSKAQPRPSQLTRSEFYSQYFAIQERIADELPGLEEEDDFKAFIDDIVEEIQALEDDTQSKLDNMPEQLQYGDTGQLMQERVDRLIGWADELSSIDIQISDEGGDWQETVREEISCTDPGIE